MLSADGETSGPEGPRISCGVDQGVDGVSGAGDGQNLRVEAGNKKRKASVLLRDSNYLAGNGGLEVECVDFLMGLMEVETLRSELDEDEKELGYCEENEKLRIEMDLKDKEMQCLRKQIEGLQAKYNKLDEELHAKYEKQHEELEGKYEKRNEELQGKYEKQKQKLEAKYEKKNEELHAKYEKQHEELQGKYEKRNEELQVKYEKQNRELEAKYEKKNEELHAKYEKQHEELQGKHEKQNEELQGKYEKQNQKLEAKYEKKNEELESMHKEKNNELQAKYEKQTEELQAKNVGLHRNIACTLENQIGAKKKQLRQLEGLYITMEFSLARLGECQEIPDNSCDEDPNSRSVDQSSAEISGVDGKADDETLKEQKLEMEVAKLDAEIEIKMDKLLELLEGAKLVEELGSATVWKSIQANIELQGIRRELINGFEGLRVYGAVGIKRMGEIKDSRIFGVACRRRHGENKSDEYAAILASKWYVKLGDPSWHPFKIVSSDGKLKEVLDDQDGNLLQLRAEYGDDVCNVVTTALIELNEYNPSGRYPVSELWNFEEGRKATLKEAIHDLQAAWKRLMKQPGKFPCLLGVKSLKY